jgi:GT2 family glycosyltransferase
MKRNLSEQGLGPTDSSVAAVVVTYNRLDLLRRWLQDLRGQTRPVQEVIVVDNASEDGTEAVILEEYPWVTYVRMSENVGPGGAWAAGMVVAYHHGHQWFWLFNDDSFPSSSALKQFLNHGVQEKDAVGILSPVSDIGQSSHCGIYWKGRVVNCRRSESAGPWFVDGVTFAGPLISRSVVDSVGYPRGDFFFMFEEYEYCLRARRAGYQIAVLPDITVTHLTAGSTGSSPPWRGYYQSRNHLALALEHHSAREVFWWAIVQSKYCAGAVLRLDCKFQRVTLRLKGAWDGLRGRLGKTIDPATFSYRTSKPSRS